MKSGLRDPTYELLKFNFAEKVNPGFDRKGQNIRSITVALSEFYWQIQY